jgi:putative ABC transport system permease protein
MQMLSELWSDLRQAFRGFRHRPGFALVVVLSLALGIGANSAIFSVVDGVLLRPLPFKDPANLVAIEENGTRISLQELHISPTVGFFYRRDQLHSFSDVLGMQWTNPQLLGAKEPEQLDGGEITANFCSVLGVQPLLGRCFSAGEQAHHDSVAILSYSLWQRQFNGDPNILGRTITLKDDSATKSFTVTGILPPQFRFPYARQDEKFDLWMPFRQDTDDGGPVSTIARLRPGVSVKQARAELLAMQRRLFPNEYDGNGGAQIVVEPVVNLVTASVKPGLVILFAAVGLVLLITCANVASLFLSRGSVQTREIAVRASLGAGRWRLCRQLITESLTLSLLGGAAGLLTASWILHGIKILAAARLPRVEEAGMNATVLAFTAAVSIFSGVLSGVLPGLRLSRVDLTTAMKAAGGSIVGGRNQQRTMNALVVFEVAVCVVSLIGAGLLVNTLIRLERVDPGFRSDHIVLAGLVEPPGKTAATEFYKSVLDRVSSTPGVEAAGLTENPPPYNTVEVYDFLLPGQKSRQGERANSRVVNADYFRALRIPLLHGRLFRDSDNAEAPHVLVISESMARHYWPGQGGVGDDAVGKFVRMGQFGKETPVEIVGVVGDVRQTGLRRAPDNQMYMHYAAVGTLPGAPTLVVRVKNDPAAFAQTGALLQTIKTAIRSVDHDQPVSDLRTMDELMAGEVADPRFYVILLSSFAALALALTVMGIAGVVAYSASRRTREMGLRICFGATRSDLLSLFAWDNVKLIVAGVALGSLTALAVTRFAKSLLFEVTPTDPATFATVALILGGVSLTACCLVALRSTLIDPAAVLKNE